MSEAPKPDPVVGFFGAALIAVGFLMMVLCGGCTTYFLWVDISSWNRPNSQGLGPAIAIFVLIVGGIPTLVGALVLRSGLMRWRRPKPPPASPPPR